MASPPNKSTSLTAACLLALAACSTLPERAWPPRVVGDLEVEYRFGADADRTIAMPESDARLTIFALHTHTAGVREEFRGGQRFWIVPPDVDTLRVHCKYRVFGEARRDAIAAAVDPQTLFPGATVLRHEARSDGDPSR